MRFKTELDKIRKSVDSQGFVVAVFFTPKGAKPELTFNLREMGRRNRYMFNAFMRKLISIKKLQNIPEFPDRDLWFFQYACPMNDGQRNQAYNEFYFATKREHPEYDVMTYADFKDQNELMIEKGGVLRKIPPKDENKLKK